MNINESIRDWINYQLPNFPGLAGIDVVTMGETGELEPPFIAIYESGSELVEQGGVILHGVAAYEITVELHTVPADESQEGTAPEDERNWRFQIYNIIGNREAIAWASGRNNLTLFDIRTTPATTEAGDGVRISRWILTVIACQS